MEENKQLANDIILIESKNKENEKKLNFCKEIYRGQIMIEKERREKEIKEKEKGIENILKNYPIIVQQNEDNKKLNKKITDKYEFILEEFIKIYEKYNEDNHNELNYLIDNHYLYKEEKKQMRFNKKGKNKNKNLEDEWNEDFNHKYVFFIYGFNDDYRRRKMITNITFDINEFIKDNYKIFKIDSKISKSIPDERQIMKIISSTKKKEKK